MKKIILHAILLMIIQGNRIYSQPVIEQADILPGIGDVFDFKKQSGITSIRAIKGQDVTWDFNYIPLTSNNSIIQIMDPAETPYYAAFPDADFSEVSPFSSGYIKYSYQDVINGSLEERGYGYLTPSGTNYAYYDNFHTLIQFPVHYADSLWDSYGGTIISSSNEIYPRHGERNYKVDGYGKLIYSTGDTIEDVLKITFHDYYVDSTLVSYDSSFSTVVSWYKADIRNPLISQVGNGSWKYIYADSLVLSFGGSYYIYLDISYVQGQLTSIDQPGSSAETDFVVFPNPSPDGQINIKGNSKIEEIKMINALGEVVYQTRPNESNISVHVDEAGIYFIQITAEKRTFLRKIVVCI